MKAIIGGTGVYSTGYNKREEKVSHKIWGSRIRYSKYRGRRSSILSPPWREVIQCHPT